MKTVLSSRIHRYLALVSTFSGVFWDIVAVDNSSARNLEYVWNTVDDETYPFLSWQPVWSG